MEAPGPLKLRGINSFTQGKQASPGPKTEVGETLFKSAWILSLDDVEATSCGVCGVSNSRSALAPALSCKANTHWSSPQHSLKGNHTGLGPGPLPLSSPTSLATVSSSDVTGFCILSQISKLGCLVSPKLPFLTILQERRKKHRASQRSAAMHFQLGWTGRKEPPTLGMHPKCRRATLFCRSLDGGPTGQREAHRVPLNVTDRPDADPTQVRSENPDVVRLLS